MIHRLTIICLIVILVEVLSQGGGSRSSSRSISRSSSNSRGGGGNLSGLTIFFIVSSSFLGACCSLFCCGFLIYAVCSKKDGRKRAANGHSKDFNAKQIRNELIVPINTNDIFESGKWSSRYQQYSEWHGPFQLDIMFDIDQNTLSGGGTDDIGQFSLTGKISTELLTINIRKKYILGTGNAELGVYRDREARSRLVSGLGQSRSRSVSVSASLGLGQSRSRPVSVSVVSVSVVSAEVSGSVVSA
jgi:hypothetical protein